MMNHGRVVGGVYRCHGWEGMWAVGSTSALGVVQASVG